MIAARIVTGPTLPINPIDGLGGLAGGLFGGTVSSIASAILDALSTWVAKGTAGLIASLATVLDHVTRPDLSAAWFGGRYQVMFEIALLLSLPMLFGAAISSILRQDAGPLVRALFVHLPLAALGTGVAVSVASLALGATDELCAAISSGTSSDAHALLAQLASTLDAGLPGLGGFGVVVVAVVLAVGAFLLTLELIVRSAAVYVAMLFLPLALAGLVWPPTARWGKRLAEMLTALILSKFVVVAIVSLAVAALSGGAAGQGLSGVLTGAALLLLAAVAPFALLRMAPIVEASAVGHLEGAGRRVALTPDRAGHAAEHAGQDLQRILDRVNVGSGGAPSGDATAPGPSPLPVETGRVGIAADGTQGAAAGVAPAFAAVGAGAAMVATGADLAAASTARAAADVGRVSEGE